MTNDETRHLAREVIPGLIGQTITKALLATGSFGDQFAGFETDQGVQVWVQADPEGNPGGWLEKNLGEK